MIENIEIFNMKMLVELFGILIAIDFILGVLVAGKENKLKSRSCSNGILRSVAELTLFVIFAYINHKLPELNSYLTMFMLLFVVKELISVCESLQKLDVWLPKFIVKLLPEIEERLDNGEMPAKKMVNK